MSICTMVHNEASYIKEWIEYHRLIKVDHFYIYDDRSTDNIKQVLQPYIDAGIVSLYYWNNNKTVAEDLVIEHPLYTRNQRFCIADCIYHHQQETDWIGVWDVDEFLYINPSFSDFNGVITKFLDPIKLDYFQVPLTIFGPSNHTSKPSGLVMENYHWRAKTNMFGYDRETDKFVGKSIYRSGCGAPEVHIAEKMVPTCNAWREFPNLETRPDYPAQFKHYFSKSWEEYSTKMSKWGWGVTKADFLAKTAGNYEFYDEDMDIFVPAVKKAIKCTTA